MASTLHWLRDKVYWRSEFGWHCYRRVASGRYQSLCGRYEIRRINNQKLNRPTVWARCGRCDGLEMERRGLEESAEESSGWTRSDPNSQSRA